MLLLPLSPVDWLAQNHLVHWLLNHFGALDPPQQQS
jgi:hypothetical protein